MKDQLGLQLRRDFSLGRIAANVMAGLISVRFPISGRISNLEIDKYISVRQYVRVFEK